MKKIFIFSALASIIFTSCQKESSLATTSSAKKSEVVLTSSQSSNGNGASVSTFDLTGFEYPVENLCTGSTLTFLSGTGHVAVHEDSKPWNFTFNLQNVVVQAADGTIYRGGGINTYEFPKDYDNTVPWEQNNAAHFHLTTAGGGNNISLNGVFKLTVNANGIFTVDFTKITLTCR